MKGFKQLLVALLIVVVVWLLFENKHISLNSNINQVNKTEIEQIVKTPDPKILKKAFKDMDTLIVATGEEEYLNTYREPKYWNLGFRELNMDLTFIYGLGIDMSKIDVAGFTSDGAVIIKLPKNEIKLNYLKLDLDNSKINGDNSFAVKGFNPTEVKVQLAKAENSVKDKILKDKVIFQQSEESLRNTLRDISTKMGFTQVLFEE